MLPGLKPRNPSFFAAIALFACVAVPAAAGKNSALRKVLVPKSGNQGLELARNGGKLLVDYGGFELWGMADNRADNLKPGAQQVQERLHLRGGKFVDTRVAPAKSAIAARTDKQGGALRTVQFIGPVRREWLDGLRGTGARIVSYMPDNGYVVWCDKSCNASLGAFSEQDFVQWSGDFQSDWKLDPNLVPARAAKMGVVDVTVQLVDAPELKNTVSDLMKLATRVIQPATRVLDYTTVSVSVPASALDELPGWPGVFNVEQYVQPEKRDEVQGQIMAGNLTTSGSNVVPTGPGYLAWLVGKGFPTTPASYPVVDIVDDGIDMGDAVNIRHPDFRELGDASLPSRVAYIGTCTSDPLGDGLDGHGNLNAGIVGGYNARTGSAYQDVDGYHYGLGISPFGRVAGTRIFGSSGSFSTVNCGGGYEGIYQRAWRSGARITSNSWGARSSGAYTTSSLAFDVGTRDASPTEAGNQEILHVFSAGNSGPSTYTIGAPGTAKNVLTVGATENVRAEGTYDGCNTAASNSADDVIDFSSRGPTSDGRMKPDITAPGVHITGPASQHPNFTGNGVCGMPNGSYYPIGQTLYSWSSGTSHSCPAAAGAAQLAYEYYGRVLEPGAIPSPAMLKALIVNSARYISGYNAGTTLPTTTQGWGDVNLGRLFDDGRRQTVDQSFVFQQSGENHDLFGSVADPTKPLRITLAWTDAPGNTTGAAYVNDLDLEVTVGGTIYRGNVFSGQYSTTGGASDVRNNIENVFLPAGTTGPVSIRVLARNIAGDGVPGNADLTDQDFALVAYNVSVEPRAILYPDSVQVTKIVGNPLVGIEPGDSLRIRTGIRNAGDLVLAATEGGLRSVAGTVSLSDSSKSFPELEPATRSWGSGDYSVKVAANHPCGAGISLRERLVSGTDTLWRDIALPGKLSGGSDTSRSVPVSIRDYDSAIASITTTRSGNLKRLKARVGITHTYTGDLKLELVSPSGARRVLANRVGGGGDNFVQTVFDDSASLPISSGSAPFTGSFRPVDSLGALKGASVKGTWKLVVSDLAGSDYGNVNFFALDFQLDDSGCSSNRAPMVDILAPVADGWLGEGDTLSLSASVTDDGRPGPLSSTWNSTLPLLDTLSNTAKVVASGVGSHIVRLSVTDGELTGRDSVSLRVFPALAAPTTLSTVPDTGIVRLQWNGAPPADSVKYLVERSDLDTTTADSIGFVSGDSFVDNWASQSTAFRYRVTSVRANKRVPGAFSDTIRSLPFELAEFQLAAGDGLVRASWRPFPLGIGPSWSYSLLRSETQDGPFLMIATTTGSSVDDMEVQNGRPYWYVVVGSASNGNTATSRVDSVTPGARPLPPPDGLEGTAGSHRIELRWNPVVSLDGPVGYEIQNSVGDAPFVPVANTSLTNYSEVGIPNGIVTKWRVVAMTGETRSEPSAVVTLVPRPDTLLPPANLRGIALSHKIELSWDSVVSTEGPVTYEVQTSDGVGPFMTVEVTADRHFVSGPIPNGLTTHWRIVAVNAETRSEPSSVVTLVPRPDTLLPPANLRGIALSHKIELSWDSVVSTEGPVTYEVQTSDGVGPFMTVEVTADRHFVSGPIPNGLTTHWRIVAVNAETRSEPSAVVTLVPRPDTLLPPANLRGIALSHKIELSWDSVVSTEGPVTYEVQTSDGVGPFMTVEVTANRHFVSGPIPNGLTTHWRIVAVNAETRSEPSSVVTLVPRPDSLPVPVVVASGAGDRRAWLQWNRVISTEGPVEYEVFRSTLIDTNSVLVWSGVDSIFEDGDLANGQVYLYKVRARNPETTSPWSALVRLEPFAAPEPIDSLKAVWTGDAIELTIWTVFEPGDSLQVFRAIGGSDDFVLVAAVAASTYRDLGTVAGNVYDYKARHLRKGLVGEMSAVASVRVPLTPPPAPTGLRAVAGDRRVQLAWNPVVGARDYVLRRSALSTGPFSVIATPVDTLWADTGLVNGMTYFYTVSARNQDAEGVASEVVSISPVSPLPPAPTGLAAIAGNRGAQLSWNAVAGAVRYIVKMSTTAGGPYARVDSTTTTGLSVGNLANGTIYRFVVSAVNPYGEGANSSEVQVAPVAPSALKVLYKVGDASATDGTIRPLLQIANSGSTPVDLSTLKIRYWYTNEQNRGQAFWCDWAQVGSSNLTGTWTALNPTVPGADGYMEISFKSAAGSIAANGNSGEMQIRITRSDWSNHNETGDWSYDPTKTAFTAWDRITLYQNGVLVWGTEPRVATPPAKVTGLAAVAGNRQIVLTWASANATSYNVYRKAAGGSQVLARTLGALTWTDTGLVNGTTYTYWVSGANGSLEGPKSDSVVASPRGTAPAKVTGLVGTPGNRSVAMTWNASSSATGYKIRRGIGATASVIATVSGTSYRDTTAGNDTAWTFSVVASNEWGDAAASDSVVVTPRAPQPPAKVTGLVAVAGNRQVVLTWATASATSYNVYRKVAGGSQVLARTLNALTWTDTGLVNGTSYTYWVSGSNGSLEGPKSDSAVAIPQAPVAGLKVQYKVGNIEPSTNAIRPLLQLVNTGATSVPLSEVTIRYWFTNDGAANLTYWCDWAQIGSANLTGSFRTVSPARPGADRYLELSFKTSAGSLATGASTGEIQSRFSKTDWSNFTQTGDASFGATQSNYADWTKVTVYRNGTLVWGTEP